MGRATPRPTGTFTRLLLPEDFEETADRFDAAVEVRDMKLLVGCVQIVVRQAHAHHYGRNVKHVIEIRHNGNGAAAARIYRVLVEHLVERLVGGLHEPVVRIDNAGGTFAMN